MTKSLSEQQKNTIRNYIEKGYSANQIQLKLQRREIGIRRKVLLAEIRKIKHQQPKAQVVKYIPKKYKKAKWTVRAKRIRLRPLGEKQIVLSGLHDGKMVTITKQGSGKELYRFVLNEIRSDYWDEKPRIHS